MHIEVDWDDVEKTIICYRFYAGWTLTEFHRAFHIATEMVQKTDQRIIGVIVDDRKDATPPKNALMAFRRTVREGRLPIALVGLNRNAKILMDVAEGAFNPKRPIFYVDTFEEARAELRKFARQLMNDTNDEVEFLGGS